jgi:hypothetical protein
LILPTVLNQFGYCPVGVFMAFVHVAVGELAVQQPEWPSVQFEATFADANGTQVD